MQTLVGAKTVLAFPDDMTDMTDIYPLAKKSVALVSLKKYAAIQKA